MAVYFFIGVGGSGMSAIAQVLAVSGHKVLGSDRNYDRDRDNPLYEMLRAAGVGLFPQDGSGVTGSVDTVVVSTAIEDTVPDMKKARELGIAVKHRSEVLAEIVNAGRGVAVGGTSGKSTVTGMIGHALAFAGLDPTVINGGKIKNFSAPGNPGNTRIGGSGIVVVESDESDGSIVRYRPEVSIITNITLDHKPLPELRELFSVFIGNTTGLAVINADCPEASSLDRQGKRTVTFSLGANPADIAAEDVKTGAFGSSFRADGTEWKLAVPGMHNIANALACIAVCRHFGVERKKIVDALAGFSGIGRRYDVVGEASGVTVIDDFAHNPDKIRATLETLHLSGRRLLLVFQPHGFAPTKLMKEDLVRVFAEKLGSEDILFMPEIFYAGGTANRVISSAELISEISAAGKRAVFMPSRPDIAVAVASEAASGDIVAVMGARDDSLTAFCGDILAAIGSGKKAGL